MNQKEFNEVIIRQTDRCKSMLVAKGAEYAPRAVRNTAVDRLAHFKKAAVVLNTTPRAALMGMLSKHLISNVGNREYEIKMGDKVGQLVIMPVLIPDFTFENWKERGMGAFGSTGR